MSATYQVKLGRWELMRVVMSQAEEADLPDTNWREIWCVDCDQCSEPFQGSLEAFIDLIVELGWAVVNAGHATAICPNCQDLPDTSTWAEQYREGSGGLL